MRISFDLDDTLICYAPEIAREPNRVPWWWRWKFEEPLRLGAVELGRELARHEHEVWIYTTSYRDPSAVKRWLGFYGWRVGSVVNADLHARVCGNEGRRFSKLPSRFDIALHIDDEAWEEWGERFGFLWLRIEPTDENWTARVLQAVEELEIRNTGRQNSNDSVKW